MRTIRWVSRFKRDYRREKSGKYGKKLDTLLAEIFLVLQKGGPLPERFDDHALIGTWKDYRDCHVRPDLILIYRIFGEYVELTRLGSHSELGL